MRAHIHTRINTQKKLKNERGVQGEKEKEKGGEGEGGRALPRGTED